MNKIKCELEYVEFYHRQLFYTNLEKLLSINGKSGEEEIVRQFVYEQLSEIVDHITVDQSGNILEQKKYHSGNGPTILLSAHLDIGEDLEHDRVILKNGKIWSSSKGILGADDRAGVAVRLQK